jgi:hypothetical protein
MDFEISIISRIYIFIFMFLIIAFIKKFKNVALVHFLEIFNHEHKFRT